jgi:hypothetical protein
MAGVGKGNGSAARHHLDHCAHVHVGQWPVLCPFMLLLLTHHGVGAAPRRPKAAGAVR